MKLAIICLCISMSGCYFFRKKNAGEGTGENKNPVIGTPLGNKAGGPDYAALEDIYALTTDHAPAAVRPDPDTYIRNLLLQYREEGTTVAREIGRVEQYRQLLGGASEDFSKEPQDRYDATSLLASIKVAEELCRGLVAPTSDQHGNWQTILPESPSRIDDNIEFLAQRFIGIHSDSIPGRRLDNLRSIYDLANTDSRDTHSDYIPVCAVLVVDAEGLLL